MASLRKKPRSPFWFACFTLPDGRRVQRSTKETARKKAQQNADEWEQLSKSRAKARQAQRVIADIYKTAHAETLPDETIRAFTDSWLKRREKEVSEATSYAYRNSAKKFLNFLSDDADLPLAELETNHFIGFRNEEAKRLSATTVNHYVKHLRIIFEDARRDGFLAENPARDCPRLKKNVSEERGIRRPFTVAELKKILAIADDEMRSLTLFGLYTGQRLGDLTQLTWANIDEDAHEVQLSTKKTGRIVRIPIAEPLRDHIATLPAHEDPNAYLHPRAAESAGQTTSNRFTTLLASAGLVPKRTHKKKQKGDDESERRTPSRLSFHSLRHTATSLMKNAGISPAVVQDIIGHESKAVSASYTHIESEIKREAIEAIPDLVAK
jgi:integrase